MRGWKAIIIAAALCVATAAPAQADELPPPTVRPSARPAPIRRAPRAHVPPTRTVRVAARADKALPYRLPYKPAPKRNLPVSGPRRTASARSNTYVPPLPGNWVDARKKTTRPARRRRAPAVVATTAVPVLRTPPVRGTIAQAAPTPRSRTVARRVPPRPRPVRSLNRLTVPCAPGQKAPVEPVRRSLDLIRPPGTCDG